MALEKKGVRSSNITSVAYDKETSEMQVTFTSGVAYKYEDVPEDVFTSLVEAKSVGSYFSKNIRSNYEGVRV